MNKSDLSLIALLHPLLDGPDSSYRCGVHDCIEKIRQHEADPSRHTVINVLEVATGIKVTNTLIQKFERAIIEENDGSFNPQKKIPLAQIITIIRQHEAEQLTVRGASPSEEGVASPQGDIHALNDCAKDLAEYEHSGDCLGFNKTQLRKLWEFAQKDWSRNEISVSRDIEIERERGNYWKGRLFELDTQRLKEREIVAQDFGKPHLFDVVEYFNCFVGTLWRINDDGSCLIQDTSPSNPPEEERHYEQMTECNLSDIDRVLWRETREPV